ncbi:MAG: aspartate/glutamate racemase family protein [Candidatus Binatia bacterium]
MIRVAFVIGGYPPEEHKRRAEVAMSYSTQEIQVGIVDVEASPYFYGMTPTEIQLVAPAFIESFKHAEREGYHAVVPLGTLDLGVDGGKSAVDIPVVGPIEAALHVASLIGDRFGLIVYHRRQLPFLRAIVRRYGMEDRVVEFGVSGFDLPDLAKHHDEVVANFVSEAKRLIDLGAEVIIPMGISQCPVHIKPDFLQEQLGVPVVEAIGAPIRMAALLAGLGLQQSRLRWPKSMSK